MQYKTCTKCGKELPATAEWFVRSSRNKCGFVSKCKVCDKAWREENKEKIKQWNKEYHANNIEEIKEKKKKYHIKNKERICEKTKIWRENNPGRYTGYMKKYRKDNYHKYKNYFLQKGREYREKYPERGRMKAQKRKAKIFSLPASLTCDQWLIILKRFNYQCAYCGLTELESRNILSQRLHQEHFIPVSKGGEYTHNNIIPACKSCNSSKQDKDFFEWYPQQEFYSKEREQKILDFLGYQQGIQQLTIAP